MFCYMGDDATIFFFGPRELYSESLFFLLLFDVGTLATYFRAGWVYPTSTVATLGIAFSFFLGSKLATS